MADVLVLSSSTRHYKPGQELRDSTSITLADGDRLSLLLPSNAVRDVTGPFSGTIGDLASGRPSGGNSLWAMVKNYWLTGGVSESQVAATRAMTPIDSPAKPASSAAMPWDAIPLNASGIFCAASGEPVKIVRDGAAEAIQVRLADKKMVKIGLVRFSAGASEAVWPESVPLVNEAGYRFIREGHPPAEFTLKLLDKPDLEGPDVLATLYGKGCSGQITAWLKDKAGQ
jgi:hypothetical protein